MSEAMVTGRMDQQKKKRVGHILKREGLNASQAINMMYDRVAEEGNVDFLKPQRVVPGSTAWKSAAEFVDSLTSPRKSRFDNMTDAEIRMERLKHRGLI